LSWDDRPASIRTRGRCTTYDSFAIDAALARFVEDGLDDFWRRGERRAAWKRGRRIVFDRELNLARGLLSDNVGNHDLSLALIEQDHSAALATSVARRLVVYMKRPGGQRQYSEPLELQQAASAPYDSLMQKVASRRQRRPKNCIEL
jgi:hypothetical protein